MFIAIIEGLLHKWLTLITFLISFTFLVGITFMIDKCALPPNFWRVGAARTGHTDNKWATTLCGKLNLSKKSALETTKMPTSFAKIQNLHANTNIAWFQTVKV